MQETHEMQLWSLGWKDAWRRAWQATPVFLPGKFLGQRSLAGYRPWGCKEPNMTEHTLTHTHAQVETSHLVWRLGYHAWSTKACVENLPKGGVSMDFEKKKKSMELLHAFKKYKNKKKTLLNRENLTYRGLNCDIRWNHARNIVFLQHKAKGRWWGMKIMGWNEGFVLWVMKLLKDFKVGMMIWFPSRIVSIPVDVITRPICPVDRPWGKKKKKLHRG